MGKFIDLTGRRFGRLTVVERVENQKKETMWLCLCDCGNEKIVSSGHLRDRHTQSCGCYGSAVTAERNYRHGLAGTRLYKIYYGILQRCCIESNPAYPEYGGRGIDICTEWKDDFLSFYRWSMENGYNEYLSIDRIDNDKGYSPDNCRWVDKKIQSNNRRSNIKTNGKSLKEMCEDAGVKYTAVYARVRRGQEVEYAIKAVKGGQS